MTDTPSTSGSSDKPETPTGTTETPPPQVAPGGYPPYPAQGDPALTYTPYAYPPPPPGAYPGSYPAPPPPPYAGYAAPPAGPKNGLGLAALISSILSLPAAFTIVGGFVLALAGIILGFLGFSRARKGEATNGGIAVAGIIVGVLGIVASSVLIAVGVWGFYKVGGGDYFDCMRRAGSDRAAQSRCEDEFRGNLENRFSITLTPAP